ncbi:MAG: FecR family protein [Flavobacteriaceae bacterium]
MEKDYLIDKWLNEGLNDSEMETFRKREDYEELMAVLEHAEMFKASGFSKVEDFESLKSRFDSRKNLYSGTSWIKPLMRIAAVLLLGIGLFYLVFDNDTIRIETIAGEKKRIELPDASIVVLNAASEISYDKDRWADERMISLKGEAFFDVRKGSSFEVATTTGTVTVLGTEFNVKQRSDHFEVRCFEGKVEVRTAVHRNKLMAGEHFNLLGERLMVGKNSHQKPHWMENISSFQGIPIIMVVEELERQYNIEVELEGVQDSTLFTGGFEHENLENALKAITLPLNLNYRIESADHVSIFPSEK